MNQQRPDAQQLISQVANLRSEGLPWQKVQRELGMDRGELAALRWQRAAELHLRNWSWKAVAADPAVGYKPAYLKNHHKKATLPGGLSFAEYVGSYREGMREQSEAIARREGMEDAQLLHSAARLLLEETQASIEALRDHRLNWRDHLLTEILLKAAGDDDNQEKLFGSPSTLDFAIPEAADAPPPSYNGNLLRHQKDAAETLRKVQQVLQGSSDNLPQAEEQLPPATREELASRLERCANLQRELSQYAGLEGASA